MKQLGLYTLIISLNLANQGCGFFKQNTSGEWIASVNGRKITLEEWEQTASKIENFAGKSVTQENAKKELLKDLIDKELIFQKALKDKIYERSLFLKDQIVQEYLRENITRSTYEPTEAEINQVYEKRRDDLDKIRASHILIKPKKPGDVSSEKEAELRALKLLTDLRSKGGVVDFSEFAKKHSEDLSTKNQGGDLLYFKKKDMVEEFSKAAFSLTEIGQISDVIKTKFGYHIIKLTGDQRGMQNIKPQISHYILKQKQKEKADALITELRAKASIKIKENVLSKSGNTVTKGEVKE